MRKGTFLTGGRPAATRFVVPLAVCVSRAAYAQPGGAIAAWGAAVAFAVVMGWAVVMTLLWLRQRGAASRAAAARIQERRHWQNLLDTVPAPVWHKDREGVYQGCNVAFAEWVMGMSKEAVIGRTVDDMAPAIPKHLALVYRARDAELLRDGGVQCFESDVRCADGEYHHFFFNKAPLSDEAGNVTGIAGVMLDISDRKQGEERLEWLSRVFLEFEANPQANIDRVVRELGVMLSAGAVVYARTEGERVVTAHAWNLPEGGPNWCALADCPFGEMVRRDTGEVVTIRNLSHQHCMRPHCSVRTGRYETCVGRVVRRDGAAAGALCVLFEGDVALREYDERLLSFVASAIGVEEHRHEAQRALRESEERFRTITAAALDAILVMDDEGRIIFWNDAAERIFGWSAEEARGQQLHPLLSPPEYREHWKRGLAAFRSTGRGDAFGRLLEMEAIRKNTERFPIELSVSGVRMRGQWHAIGIVRDISERKRHELELANRAQELEQTNAEMEEAMARANEMATKAEVASAAKSEFLANMSHEIRTPLNGVVGMTEILLESENLSADQRECTEVIQRSGNALLTVINDILDFSKIEAGRLELEHVPFDLHEVLEDVAELVAQRAQAKRLAFSVVVGHDFPRKVTGDPGRLRQILLNLAGNAVKFTERGEVVLRGAVRAVETDVNRVDVELSVADTGIGVPPNRLAALFDPFTQAETSTTRKYGGTGLGLAICKRLCEAMDGSIHAESAVGEGSRFVVRVPFDVAEARCEVHPPLLAGLPVLSLGGTPGERECIRGHLSALGAVTEQGVPADGLVPWVEAHPNGLIVVDAESVDMDALLAPYGDVPPPSLRLVTLVPMTRKSDGDGLPAGVQTEYLTKPVRCADLIESVERLTADGMDPAPAAAEAQRQAVSPEALSLHLLLVEDNEVNQKVAMRVLGRLGCTCDIADNGMRAVEAVALRRYDGVLMDCQMPVMDGFQATRTIRSRENGGPHVPIIAMTAMAMAGDERLCADAGMDDYVTKPIRVEALAAALARIRDDEDGNPHRGRNERMSNPSDEPLVDLGRLDEVAGDDVEFQQELIDSYVEDTDQRLEALDKALDAGDASAARDTAHALKGASGNLGATRVYRLAMEAERAAADGNLDTVRELVPQLLTEYNRTKVAYAERATDA